MAGLVVLLLVVSSLVTVALARWRRESPDDVAAEWVCGGWHWFAGYLPIFFCMAFFQWLLGAQQLGGVIGIIVGAGIFWAGHRLLCCYR